LSNRFLVVSVMGSLAAVGASAQTAAPPSEKAAMERALQQADGPKRRILEAARLKAGAAPTPAPVPAPQAVAGVRPRVEATERPTERSADKPVEKAPENDIITVVTLPGAIEPVAIPRSGGVGSVATVAPLEATPRPATMIDLPPAAPPVPAAATPPPAEGLPAPRLVTMVEPELPARLFRRGSTRTEIVVDLVINVDGSIKSAAVRSSNNADVESAVLEAVLRWRYEPQAVTRPHLVRLVVSPS
jgi:TonB family protein